ncbi:hypothetical protein YC2023_074515 [Brassica napus]
MSMKSAVKFDFILATFKISQNCLLLFLELLALYEGYLTHVQGRVTHLFIFRSPIEDILISQSESSHYGKNILNSSNDTLKIEAIQHLIAFPESAVQFFFFHHSHASSETTSNSNKALGKISKN